MLKKVRRAIEQSSTASEQSLSVGVALAFGLTVLSGAYALGPISGGHFNHAVSVGLWARGRFPAAHLGPYVVTQVAGALMGAGVLYLIASGKRTSASPAALPPVVMRTIHQAATR